WPGPWKPRPPEAAGAPQSGLADQRRQRRGEIGPGDQDPPREAGRAGQLDHRQAGPFAYELTSGNVPRLDSTLEIGVIASGCRPRQVERRAAETAYVSDLGDQTGEHLALRGANVGVVGEAGRDHRARQRLRGLRGGGIAAAATQLDR